MRFKFCGNIDSPEWLISEIIYLTKISAIRLRIICNNIALFIINSGKNFKDIQKNLDDMNFNDAEGKIIFSLLDFILRNSVKFDIEDNILSNELQHLGLPLENAESIVKIFKNQKEKLKKKLSNEIFSNENLKEIDYKISYVLDNDINDFKNNEISENKFEEEKTKNLDDDNFLLSKIEGRILISLGEDKENKITFSSNKETLGKLINDLNKANDLIRKFKEA